MASPAFSFCAAVENSVQMLFIEIETDPYTATRLAGNDLAAAFKEKCAAEGIPQAQIIKKAIEDFLSQ